MNQQKNQHQNQHGINQIHHGEKKKKIKINGKVDQKIVIQVIVVIQEEEEELLELDDNPWDH